MELPRTAEQRGDGVLGGRVALGRPAEIRGVRRLLSCMRTKGGGWAATRRAGRRSPGMARDAVRRPANDRGTGR
jgi:hypothetical protein